MSMPVWSCPSCDGPPIPESRDRCPRCGAPRRTLAACRPDDFPPYPRGMRWGGAHGQAIAELALTLPLLLFLLLAVIELALLGSAKLRQDGATLEAARWAVAHPEEPATGGADAFGLSECYVESEHDSDAGIVTVRAMCDYAPVALRGFWDGLPIGSEASAAVPGAVAGQTAAPSGGPEPSGSVEP